MAKRTPWRVAVVPVSCLLVLAVGGPGRSQAPPAADPIKPPTITEPVPPPEAPKAARSVEDLVAQLAKVRQQQFELAGQEKALVDELRAKHGALTEALLKLGVLAPPKDREVAEFPLPRVPVVQDPTGIHGVTPAKGPPAPK